MANSMIIGLGLGFAALSAWIAGEVGSAPATAGSTGSPAAVMVPDRATSGVSGQPNAVSDFGTTAGVDTQALVPMTQAEPASASDRDSAYVPAGYVKVFADEFSESRLDTSKWWTRYIHGGGTLDVLNDEAQRYRESGNHVMTGHSLTLLAKKVAAESSGDDYQSGMIRSKTSFKYGYFEARMKVPDAIGVRPAFWLNPSARSTDGKIAWPPEIDIAELANNGAEDTMRMLHVGLISHGAQAPAVQYADPNFHQDWNYLRRPPVSPMVSTCSPPYGTAATQ